MSRWMRYLPSISSGSTQTTRLAESLRLFADSDTGQPILLHLNPPIPFPENRPQKNRTVASSQIAQ